MRTPQHCFKLSAADGGIGPTWPRMTIRSMALLKSLGLDFCRVRFCRLFTQTNQSGSFAISHSPGCIAIKLRTVCGGRSPRCAAQELPRRQRLHHKDDRGSLPPVAKRRCRARTPPAKLSGQTRQAMRLPYNLLRRIEPWLQLCHIRLGRGHRLGRFIQFLEMQLPDPACISLRNRHQVIVDLNLFALFR